MFTIFTIFNVIYKSSLGGRFKVVYLDFYSIFLLCLMFKIFTIFNVIYKSPLGRCFLVLFKDFTDSNSFFLFFVKILMKFLVIFFYIILGVTINSFCDLYSSDLMITSSDSFLQDSYYFQWYFYTFVSWDPF